MNICNELPAFSVPCEPSFNTPIDLDWLIENKYITKQEVEIYKAAEQKGFDVSISISADFVRGRFIETTNIEIKKTKIK